MTKTQNVKEMQQLYFKKLLLLLMFVFPLSLWGQTKVVTGRITDSNNEPVIGASVIVKNLKEGTVTNGDGKYSIKVPENATLVFKYIGLTTKEEKVGNRSEINVAMDEVKNIALDELVVVGYGTQKKVTLTGSVAGVKGSDMIKTKNENPQNMLTGKVAGVRVWQKSAEPGSFNANFDIRGMGAPLVVIDGIPRETSDFQRLNPEDIEDISVLKDASAAIYGVRAGNGVVLVTTKKGTKDGKTKVTYNGSYTLQQPSKMPELADAFQTMTLYNERSMNNINGGSLIYKDADFEAFRNGSRRTTDWNSLIFSNISPQTQHDVSISGGTDKTQYYIGIGSLYQEGFFKSGDLNYNKTNLRSNITSKIATGLTVDLNLSGVLDEQHNPYSTSSDIIRNYWRQGVLFPAYADKANTMLNYDGLDLEENTVAKMTSDISGYRKYGQKSFQSSAALNYDLGTVLPALKGLSAKLLYSFDYRMNDNTIFRKEYYQYAYNESTDSYTKKLFNASSPSQLRREFYDQKQTLGQFLLNYNRTFGNHTFSGVYGFETQKNLRDNFYAQRNLAFATDYLFAGVATDQIGAMSSSNNDLREVAYSAMIGRLNYAYGSRYIAEAQFRYDGSSYFAKGHQWGFFPSASLGWRISEEPLFKSIEALSFVNQLKLRASYGELGNDESAAYGWVSGYDYPSTSGNAEKGYYNQYAPGYMFGGNFVYGATPRALSYEAATWARSRTFDIGVDFEAWNGLFGCSFDYFDRHRDQLLARPRGDLPTVVGADAPQENLNSDRHFGIDLELSHRNKIGNFQYRVKAIGTITRQKWLLDVEKNPAGNSYDNWRNDNTNYRYQGIQFGYESAGRYTSWADIKSYQIYKEKDVLPGDYKYKDWNGDGEINSLDEHPYAYDQTPWVNYSLSFDCSYKHFDLNILFQGSALGSMEYKEPLYSIWGSNGGGTLTQYLDRWHPLDPTADPYDPSTKWVSGYYGYTGRYPMSNSEFNRVSTAYLRLKSIELGYTLPRIKALSSMSLRIFANAYNLFTLTGVKFVDPEHPDDDLGRLYPLNKTYTVGMSLSF